MITRLLWHQQLKWVRVSGWWNKKSFENIPVSNNLCGHSSVHSKFTRCTWMHQESLFKLRHRETAEDRKQRALYYRTIKSFYPPALQVAFRDLLFNFGSCWCIIKGGWRRISHTHCLLLGANLTPAYPEHKAADWAGSIPVCTNRPFLPTELSATLSYFFTKKPVLV